MAKAKKSTTSNGRKSPNIKPLKRAPKAAAKRNSAIPTAAPRRAASNGAVGQRGPRQPQRPQLQQRPQPQAHAQQQASQPQRLPRVSGEITQDMIARRAFEIYCSGTGGSDFDNWCRAERELRGA